MGCEALEGLRFLASLPLAGTRQREGGGFSCINKRIISHPVTLEHCHCNGPLCHLVPVFLLARVRFCKVRPFLPLESQSRRWELARRLTGTLLKGPLLKGHMA